MASRLAIVSRKNESATVFYQNPKYYLKQMKSILTDTMLCFEGTYKFNRYKQKERWPPLPPTTASLLRSKNVMNWTML